MIMASKRHMRRKACEGKRSYPTKEAAISASVSLRKRTGERTNAYGPCKFCGHYHHGHMARRTKQALRVKRERGY